MVVVALVAAGVGGYRIGFVTRVVSWVGMAIGLAVAARLLPVVLRSLEDLEQVTLLLIAVGLLLTGAFLGQAIGLLAGSRLHLAIPAGAGRQADRAAGSVAGALGVIAALWLLLPTMTDIPGWTAEQSRSSVIARLVHDRLPAAPDTLQALRQLVGEEQFPRVFDALEPTPDIGPPPASTGIADATSREVVQSTVQVRGAACRRIQEGSGFVVAPDLVVTNAHVVAGEEQTIVERADGTEIRATTVAFDPARDLAVLRVPGLERRALPLAGAEIGGRGGVYGHPGGGPLQISPFAVGDIVDANGRDIYDRARTEREVLVLASDLQPGDSGAALVSPAGAVVGVAFAIAPDKPGVAYALSIGELQAVLQGDLTTPKDTGPCLA